MSFYQLFVDLYNTFLAIFPAPLQWLITLILVVGLVLAFINLIRHNWLFLIVLVVLLPFIFPILQRFFSDIWHFFWYLLTVLKLTAPKT